MKRLIFPIVMLFLAIFAVKSIGQTEEQLLAQLIQDERNSVEALVLYPDKTRLAILEASKYPELLIKLQSMQASTSKAFQELMQQYPKETQEQIWDLTRYPGLVSQLANNRSEDPSGILQGYPAEIHQRAKDAFYSHRYLLEDADRIDTEWSGAFENLLLDYPTAAKDAVRQLVELPEVLDILTNNIRMTVLVGDLYKRRPAWLLQQLDSLNLVVANERAKELNDWKAGLDENPQAKQEFIASTESFANEYNYDDAYYQSDDVYYNDEPATVVTHNYYYNYPYWSGYPYWYTYPRWRPYPWWWDWGFYYGPGRVIVIVDLPSYYFTNWYFYQPTHHYQYPHLSSQFANHYYGHRTSSSSVTSTVKNWREVNRDVVTDDWLAEARTKPAAFKEFGKFEETRETYNRKHVDKPLTQQEFLEKNTRKYPDLSKEVEKSRQQEAARRTQDEPAIRRQQPEPVVKPPRQQEPVSPKPRIEPRKNEPTRTEPDVPAKRKNESQPAQKDPNVDIPKVDKARDYHQNTWEKSRTEPKQTQPSPRVQQPPSPRVKTQPAPRTKTQPAPKTKTTPRKKGGGG